MLKKSLLQLLPIALLVLLQSGCSVVQIVVNSTTEAQMLRNGDKAFLLGNYQKAEELFTEVYESKADAQTRNSALYNLACTRIAIASTTFEYNDGVLLLEEWKRPFNSGIYIENPALIVTALLKSNELLAKEQKMLRKEITNRKNEATVQAVEIEKLRKKADSLKSLLTSYQEDNIGAQEMIEKLQNQITELETIDQQILEKKKPL